MARESLRSGRRLGLPTGFMGFDYANGGLHAGELVILAARPGGGKTSIALQIAAHSAMKQRDVLFVSLEMSGAELMIRVLCGLATVDSAAIRTGRLTERDLGHLEQAGDQFAGAKLTIDDRASVTAADIRRAARRCKRQGGLSLVVVDYLQRLTAADARAKRYEQVGAMTADLKTLARELNVPVLCLCQLNREVEKGGNGRPKLSNLRESGNIEQDADVVAFVHRPEVFEPSDPDLVGKAELIVEKNRNGPTGTFPLLWDARTTTFSDARVDFG